ncbi:MAG: NAD(P)/FAD-dependent oxidoreductase [Cyanobacteria bacterium]|nr:NAD(P)/FAD-dependent oxidoreductase [Cyanobacteriota bacterium]
MKSAGGIQWKTLQLLPFDINEVIERKIYGIYFSRKLRDVFYKKYPEPLIYTLDRKKLDDFLAKKAIASGCTINFNEKVKNFEINNDGVKVYSEKNNYFSKILVGADGAVSTISKKLNKDKNVRKIIGYEIEAPLNNAVSYPSSDDSIILDFGGMQKGYLWVFPKKDCLSIGDGGPIKDALYLKKYLIWFVKKYPFVFNEQNFFRNVLMNNIKYSHKNNIHIHDESYCNKKPELKYKINAFMIPVRTQRTFLCDIRILVTGDAAGLGDGFTGEGLYNAIFSSNIAFECIANALSSSNFKFSDYFEKINKEIYKNIRNSVLISKIFFSSPVFYYKLIKNNDSFFNACARILRGEKSYYDVLNKLKLIKI